LNPHVRLSTADFKSAASADKLLINNALCRYFVCDVQENVKVFCFFVELHLSSHSPRILQHWPTFRSLFGLDERLGDNALVDDS
jgi:hypothetical protein